MKARLAALEARAAAQEAALLDMLQRVQVLERALAFEVGQREEMERIILQMTNSLPRRVDRVEAELKAQRRRKAA